MHHQQLKEGSKPEEEEVVKLLTIQLDSEVTLKSMPRNPSNICTVVSTPCLIELGRSYRFRVAGLAAIWALQFVMVLALVYFSWNPSTIQKIRIPFM